MIKRFLSRAYRVLAVLLIFSVFTPSFSMISVASAQTETNNIGNTIVDPCGENRTQISISMNPTFDIDFVYGICIATYYVLLYIIEITASFTTTFAIILDYSIFYFVLKITEFFQLGGSQESIFSLWKIIRDLCNIIAFFGAVYLGLRRIMGLDGDSFKKSIAKLMLFAVLTNFSFPIAKFAIDMSNVVTLQFYGGITKFTFINVGTFNFIEAALATAAAPIIGGSRISQGGISSAIMEKLSIGYLIRGYVEGQTGGFSSFSLMGLIIIYLLFAVVVFIYASIMILVRTAMLFLSVVLSPLMFIGGLVPALSRVHDWWRKNFVGQLVFPPILMAMLYIAFALLEAALMVTRNTNNPDFGQQITYGSLAVIALLAAIYLSNKFAGSVGQFVGGVLGGTALVAATGGTGLAARAAIGRAGVALQRAKWVERGQGSKNALTRNMSRFVDYTGRSMENYRVRGKSYRDTVQQKRISLRQKYGGEIDEEELRKARTRGEVNTLGQRAAQNRNQQNQNNQTTIASSTAADINTAAVAGAGLAAVLTGEEIAKQKERQLLEEWQAGEGKPMYKEYEKTEEAFNLAKAKAKEAEERWKSNRNKDTQKEYNDAQREQMRTSSAMTKLRRNSEEAFEDWKKRNANGPRASNANFNYSTQATQPEDINKQWQNYYQNAQTTTTFNGNMVGVTGGIPTTEGIEVEELSMNDLSDAEKASLKAQSDNNKANTLRKLNQNITNTQGALAAVGQSPVTSQGTPVVTAREAGVRSENRGATAGQNDLKSLENFQKSQQIDNTAAQFRSDREAQGKPLTNVDTGGKELSLEPKEGENGTVSNSPNYSQNGAAWQGGYSSANVTVNGQNVSGATSAPVGTNVEARLAQTSKDSGGGGDASTTSGSSASNSSGGGDENQKKT